MQAKKLVNACFGAKKACTYCNIKRAIKPVKSTTIELFSNHYIAGKSLRRDPGTFLCGQGICLTMKIGGAQVDAQEDTHV